MAGPLFDAVERAQLCDLFDELGPEAQTLLAPWTTRDLAAHHPCASEIPSQPPGWSCLVPGPGSLNDDKEHSRGGTSTG